MNYKKESNMRKKFNNSTYVNNPNNSNDTSVILPNIKASPNRRRGILNKSLFVKDYLNEKTSLDKETKANYNLLGSLQEEKDDVKRQIKNITDKELFRLCREFSLKDYGRRFNCTQIDIFSALIGNDKALLELSKLNREYKVIKDFNKCNIVISAKARRNFYLLNVNEAIKGNKASFLSVILVSNISS